MGADLGVLHLLAPAPFGGLETVVRHLARAQAEAGARIQVAAILPPSPDQPHPFVAAARAEGIDVHTLAVPDRSYLRERRLVARLIRELEPDIVHTHGYRPDILDAPVARRAGVATVTTAHGFTGNTLKNRFYEWTQCRAFRRFDAVIAVANGVRKRLLRSGVPEERIHVVPNAHAAPIPPLPRQHACTELGLPPEGPPVIGWVGRVGPEKGPDTMIRALAEPALSEVHLCVVGEGRSVDACRSLAAELRVGDRVRWSGRVDEAGRLMAAFDVLCLSSRTEGTPMVLFEADGAGVVVVATAVGGVPQVLGDGWNLVPPEDAPALATALAHALYDPDAANEARERATRRIRTEFDARSWARRHLEIYQRVRTRPPGPVPVPGGAA
jgi:glycosyltransferase involved in cell wall biosynthesis